MRVLLLHPEDSPRRGPWSQQKWDLIVDLGKSSPFSEKAWEALHKCPIVRADSFRRGIADAMKVREVLSAGRGRLVDEDGIDWWELVSLLVAPDVFSLLALELIVPAIPLASELWVTRDAGPTRLLRALLKRPTQNFGDHLLARSATRVGHYAGLVRRFSAAQFKEILLDKYDSGYRWRSRMLARPSPQPGPVVLIPSAYGNVSRMASSFATLLPDDSFLMVTTRESAKRFTPPSNIECRELASYAQGDYPSAEIESLVERWIKLRAELQDHPELRLLSETGTLDYFLPGRIRDGLRVREAWKEVLDHEPVCGVLCGDDSNIYTRLPVLLAARRKIPTIDFHHGAIDGRYLLKELPCDRYFAKNEMERDYLVRTCGLPAGRVVIGGPPANGTRLESKSSHLSRTSAVLFSEPYEVVGMRPEEVYRELLPLLCQLARANGRSVVVKLHPFESAKQRKRIVREVLSPEDAKMITVIDGPLTQELLTQAWFGITVESTTVIDSLQSGICCFLCGWLSLSPYGYAQQYAQFGIGEILETAEQVAEIPDRIRAFLARPAAALNLSSTVDPATLKRCLTSREMPAARLIS